MSSISDCKLIDFPKFSDERGNLSFIEGNVHIPFAITRIFYLYGIKEDAVRGVHAHKECQQVMLPFCGSFDLTLDDGVERKTFHLDSPSQAVYVPKLIWCELTNFSDDAVCAVMASDSYCAEDYIDDYEEFKVLAKNQTKTNG